MYDTITDPTSLHIPFKATSPAAYTFKIMDFFLYSTLWHS